MGGSRNFCRGGGGGGPDNVFLVDINVFHRGPYEPPSRAFVPMGPSASRWGLQ